MNPTPENKPEMPPKEINVIQSGQWRLPENSHGFGELYHHDSVVQELREKLEEANRLLEPLKTDYIGQEFKHLWAKARKSPAYWQEYCELLVDHVRELQQKLTEAEAACAVKDEALNLAIKLFPHRRTYETSFEASRSTELWVKLNDALSPTCGQDLLAKVERMENYIKATEYWQIQPHDDKERKAYLAKLSIACDQDLLAKAERMEKGIETYKNKVITKLREVSKGEYQTWGFVAAFIDILEQEYKALTTQPESRRE